MQHRSIHPRPGLAYAQAVEISAFRRLLFISGQVPEDADGGVPPDYPSQYRLAWANVEAQLRAADMTFDNLVKVTIFVADRRLVKESGGLRPAVLGDRSPATTRHGCSRSRRSPPREAQVGHRSSRSHARPRDVWIQERSAASRHDREQARRGVSSSRSPMRKDGARSEPTHSRRWAATPFVRSFAYDSPPTLRLSSSSPVAGLPD